MLERRTFLTAGVPAAALVAAGCTTGSSNAVTLATAQLWLTDLANAVSAAAQVYLAQPNAPAADTVRMLVADLQAVVAAMPTTAGPDAKSAVVAAIGFVQQLTPLVTPFLGSAGPWVSIGLAILQAFVLALPMPPNAPAVPPAALHAMAARYRRR